MGSVNLSEGSCRLTVPNDMLFLPVILDCVCSVADKLGFSKTDKHRIELAVEEAAANVIKHAFLPGEKAHFDIICKRIANGMEIRIHDEGLPYDPSFDRHYTPGTKIEDMPVRGLGNFLIRELMDEYEYVNLGPGGKDTRFVKYFDSSLIASPDAAKEPEIPLPPSPGEVKGQIDFTIRRMEAEEAMEVSRCIYDSYGYSYANEHVYYPERIAALNDSGQLFSAVAVTGDKEIGGHFALIFYKKLPAEIGIAVTKKKFRGQKIAGKLAAFLDDQARDMGLKGLQVRQVTVHPYTQKFCAKLGYTDCGVLLAHSPKTLSFKGIADSLEQRNTDIVGYKYLKTPEERTVYLPERHAEIIKDLYCKLDIPVKYASPAATKAEKKDTLFDISVNSIRSVAEIHIDQYGKDFPESLKIKLHGLRREDIRVVEMYLRLSDELTAVMLPEIEKLGLFFTGILPETVNGDCIIMQYLNGEHIDYDKITVVNEDTTKLLDYIKRNDPNTI